MALSARKKKGIGFCISGVVFLGVGGIFIATATTPDWLSLAIQGVGMIAGLLGFNTVFPDLGDDPA